MPLHTFYEGLELEKGPCSFSLFSMRKIFAGTGFAALEMTMVLQCWNDHGPSPGQCLRRAWSRLIA